MTQHRSVERLVEIIDSLNDEVVSVNDYYTLKAFAAAVQYDRFTNTLTKALIRVAHRTQSPHITDIATDCVHAIRMIKETSGG
jgi:hypothetical protein